MGCVRSYAVNDLNFLRWHPAAAVELPFAVPLATCDPVPGGACTLFPEANEANDFPTLPVVDGDRLRFFINSDAAIDVTAGFASISLGLVQDGVLVEANVGTLYSLPGPTAASYFIYGDLLVDCLSDGVYWPVIYDLSDQHVLLIANPLEVINRQNWTESTVWVRFRHKSSVYGVAYSALPGFYQEFRLALSMFQPKYPTDETTYTDRNNRTRTTSLGVSRVYEIQSDFWDQATFTAAALMFTHYDVTINGKAVKIQGTLDPDYTDGVGVDWVTAKGKVLDQDFARSVLTCGDAVPEVKPE